MKWAHLKGATRHFTVFWAVVLASLPGGCGRSGDDDVPGLDGVAGQGGDGGFSSAADLVAPATLAGTVNVADFTVPAGHTTTVTADLTINATGDVVIDGEVIAEQGSPGPGYDITITSEGDMEISGSVWAGNGASAVEWSGAAGTDGDAKLLQAGEANNGKDGGFLVLGAENVRIRKTASIGSGNGGDGRDGAWGGQGGDGGLLILNGHVGLSVAGSIHLGNGGNGGFAQTTPDDLPLDGVFPNRGGDAGDFRVAGKTLDFPELQVDIPTLYILNPVDYTDNESTGTFTGGVGGSAGGVLVRDRDSSVFDALPGVRTARLAGRIGETVLAQTLEPTDDLTVEGANGGAGWYYGGAGAEVNVTTPFTLRGGHGRNWVAFGGKGGDVGGAPDFLAGIREDDPVDVVAEDATAGKGGHVSVLVADGAMGTSAVPKGGDGGSASALGGAGGHSLPLALGTGGHGGGALAQAGSGGSGLEDDCQGGNGGDGGEALAVGGIGGNGAFPGDGGEAQVSGGYGGYGGDSSAGHVGLGGEGGILDWRFGCDGSRELAPEREAISCGPQSAEGERAPDGEDGLDLHCCDCPP